MTPTGQEKIAASATGPRDDPDGLGRHVAELLRARGADRVLKLVRG